MSSVDLLLMPYQNKVSIGVRGQDTSRWMSPMKMFEYMAAGQAIVASDLPVLREILVHKHNAILTKADDVIEWETAIKMLRC